MKEARSGEGFAPNNGNALLGLNAGSFFPTCAEVKFPQVAGFDDQPAPQRRSVAGKARGILELDCPLGTELENGIDTFVRGRGRLQHHLGREYSEFSVLSL